MPLYVYECSTCGRQEEKFFHLGKVPKHYPCLCGGQMKRIISIGGIQCDSINDVKWLPSAIETLQPDGEKPIESRSEYKRYLKEKGIIAAG